MGSANAVQASLDFALIARETVARASLTDRLIATRMCATSPLYCDYNPGALVEYHAFTDQSDPALHGPAMRTGHSDHTTMVLLGLAKAYGLMGRAAKANHWRARTLAAVRASGRLYDRCHTLAFAGCFHALLLHQWSEAQAAIDEMSGLLANEALPNWTGYLNLCQGLLRVQRGEAEAGLVRARRGVRALISARVFGIWWYIIYADACIQTGAFAEAEALLAKAGAIFDTGEWRFASELTRLTAHLQRARGTLSQHLQHLRRP